MLAIGQELQRIQLVDNQPLNNIERKLPLFPNLSTLCLGQCCRHLGGILLCQEVSLGTEMQLSTPQCVAPSLPLHKLHLPPEEMHLKYFSGAASFDHFLAVPFQPPCKWNSKLYPSINPNPNVNHKPSWGLIIEGFSSKKSLLPLQPHFILTAVELPTFLSFNPDPKHGAEVRPDLHWK